jgi:hypothetical protein
LTVTPAELSDWTPGAKGVVGEVAWNASGSGIETVGIYAVNPQGRENLCFSGGPVGQGKTGPWLRPGSEFRLKDTATGETVARAIVGPHNKPATNPAK